VVAPPLPSELCDLVARVARHEHGLAFLHRAYLESVAVTLGVHPFVIDAARAYLATAEGRAELIAAVRAAQAAPAAAGADPRRPAPDARPDALALIRRAAAHPRGLGFLDAGPPLEVAAVLGVHPYLVFRARGLVERHEATADTPTPAPEG
jgi:hypothetical protein